jgi:hypothetical protein
LLDPKADRAFGKLKRCFTSGHILVPPDPTHPFVVEVDASDTGAVAYLSQQNKGYKNLHPCAFLSKRISPAEHNYDVGNRELLAGKWALKVWRHWLEGEPHPFVIWRTIKTWSPFKKPRG